MKQLKLRYHHLMCCYTFTGVGYSEAFTQNMQKTIDALQGGEELTLHAGHDHICAACPNRRPEGCALGTEDVARRDAAALRELNLTPGRTLTWEELRAHLAQVDEEGFQRVCGGCRWQEEGLCGWELLHQRATL